MKIWIHSSPKISFCIITSMPITERFLNSFYNEAHKDYILCCDQFLTSLSIFLLLSDQILIKFQMLLIPCSHYSSILEQFDMPHTRLRWRKVLLTLMSVNLCLSKIFNFYNQLLKFLEFSIRIFNQICLNFKK